MVTQTRLPPIMVLWALLAAACSGGVQGPAAPMATPTGFDCANRAIAQSAPQGIEGSGKSKMTGPIENIESDGVIVVGCYRVSVIGATIYLDGAPGTLEDLQVGQVVTVVGTFDSASFTAQASAIYVCTTATCSTTSVVLSGTINSKKSRWSFGWNGTQGIVIVDGANAASTDIADGDVVLINGQESFNGGSLTETAQSTTLHHVVVGSVDQVDVDNLSLTVMGQAVFTAGVSCTAQPAATALAQSLKQLRPGDRVAISGHASPGGGVFATRVDSAPTARPFAASGFVEALDAARSQFKLNTLTIDFSNAALLGFVTGSPSIDDRVAVYADAAPAGGILLASQVQRLPPETGGAPNSAAWIEGLITRWASHRDFDIDGYRVSLPDTGTCGDPNAPGPEFQVNDWVILSGAVLDGRGRVTQTADPNGATCLLRVEPYEITLTGAVDAIDNAHGSVSLLGYYVKTSPVTHWEGGASVASLTVGDTIVVAGLAGLLPTQIVAARIAAVPPDATGAPAIDTLAYTLKDPAVVVAGTGIATDASTVFRDTSNSAQPINMSPAQFFSGAWQGGRCYKVPLYAGRVHLSVAHGTNGRWTATDVDATGLFEGCPDDIPPDHVTALCASR